MTKMLFRACCISIDRYSTHAVFVLLLVLLSVQAYSQQVPRETDGGTKFWAYTPPGYSPSVPAPVLISLHGGSGIGDNLDILTTNISSANRGHQVPARLIATSKWNTALPFVVISPQLKRDLSVPNYNDQEWPATLVDELLEYVKTQYNIDPNRVYLTGISLGGAGVWDYASAYPSKVAAIVPISGKSRPENACIVKNIPIWAFHGENDGLVRPSFSTIMVDAINACQPTGTYKPKLNLLYTNGHEGWNAIYTLTNGYDIYSWLLSFRKNVTSNKAPFVYAGDDRTILVRPEPVQLTAEYFDSDGSIANVAWTQTSGTALATEGNGSRFLKILTPTLGTYTFRLTVTDNSGDSRFDEVVITFISAPTAANPVINALTLTNAAETAIQPLTEGMLINVAQLGGQINIRADYNTLAKSVRFSVNSDQDSRTATNTSNNLPVYLAGTQWTVALGVHRICAVGFTATQGGGNRGPSLCYTVTFTNESVGASTFYSKLNANLSTLSAWGSNADGSGTAPSSFTANNQTFIVNRAATVNDPLTISGTNSKLRVLDGGQLTIGNSLAGPLQLEGSGTVILNTTQAVSFSTISPTSTTVFSNAITTIPAGTYGNVIFRGSGTSKTLPANATTINGNVIIESGVIINSNTNNNSVLAVSGNVTVEGTAAYASARPFQINFKTAGTKTLSYSGTELHLRKITIDAGVTVNVPANTTPSVIRVGSGQATSGLQVNNSGSLFLNGNTLYVSGAGSINTANETGTIGVQGSIIRLISSAANHNLYASRGKNKAKSLEVNLSNASGILNLRDSLYLNEKITVTRGSVASTGLLTLMSTSTQTAYVAPVTTGRITGAVNVERQIRQGRLYRYLGFPVRSFTVAELQASIPVSGTFAGASPIGNPSLFHYNEPTGGWTDYPATTNTAELELGKGYAVFLREALKDTKVVQTGELHFGAFDFPVTPDPSAAANNGWNLVANPYAAPIQWGTTGWTRTGVDGSVYIRDNEKGGGGFQVFNGSTGDFNGRIAAGQAFWVRTTSATPNLVVTETAKVSDATVRHYRTADEEKKILKLTLSQNALVDNAYFEFLTDASLKFGWGDAVKQKNVYFNLYAVTEDSVSVAIKNLCDTVCSQQIKLAVEGANGTYTLKGASIEGEIQSEIQVLDIFTDSLFTLSADKVYNFTIGADPKSSGQRFTMIIESQLDQPVVSSTGNSLVSSYDKGNQWFLNGSVIEGATSSTLTPIEEGDYQVKVTGGACSKLSPVYSYRITGLMKPSEIKVYPNPASTHVSIEGLPGGQSIYSISSVTGAEVMSGTLAEGEQGIRQIDLKSIRPGVYWLKINHPVQHAPVIFKVVIK